MRLQFSEERYVVVTSTPSAAAVKSPRKEDLEVSQRSVLIVDDEADLRDSVREVLNDEGYRVFVASNGQEAPRVAKVERSLVSIWRNMLLIESERSEWPGWERRSDAPNATITNSIRLPQRIFIRSVPSFQMFDSGAFIAHTLRLRTRISKVSRMSQRSHPNLN